MELYAGQLLPAYFVDEADGFEQWLEQKRDELQREAMRACGALADVAEQDGRFDDVVKWLRRAISYFPYDESLHRRLIVAYDRAGDRAAALRTYDELVEALRKEFEAEPAAETNQIIQEVRARSETRGARERLAETAYPHPARPVPIMGRVRGRRLVTVASLGVLTMAAALWAAFAGRESPVDPPVNRIAVLFFDDATPNQELGYLADGLTTTLIDHLGQVRRVQVISQNGVRPFRGDSIPLDSIARQLDVGTIVGGTISRSGDQLRVTVEIVKGATGIVASSKTFERPSGELFALLDDISSEVGSFLRSTLGDEVRLQRYQRETESVAAWQAVQRAERLIADADEAANRGDFRTVDALLDQADSFLVRAARVDKHWETPLLVLAGAYEKRAWLAPGQEPGPAHYLRRALENVEAALQRKNSAAAFETRGRVLLVRYMLEAPTGEQAAALLAAAEQDLIRALAIEPERARAESTLSLLYEFQGRFADARQAAQRALSADAYLEDADQITVRLFQSSFELGDDEGAGHWCDEVRKRHTGRWPAAYCDLILLAWRSQSDLDARKVLFILETFGANDDPAMREAMRPRLMVLAASALARSGDVERAERMVRDARAAAPHDPELLYFEAALRMHLQQHTAARELLGEYVAQVPNARARIENGRIFRPLREARVTRTAAEPR
jgi:TolB-like protein/Flp pilus assembly protein TadD